MDIVVLLLIGAGICVGVACLFMYSVTRDQFECSEVFPTSNRKAAKWDGNIVTAAIIGLMLAFFAGAHAANIGLLVERTHDTSIARR